MNNVEIGAVIKKGNDFFDVKGSLLPDTLGDYILIYKGRKELLLLAEPDVRVPLNKYIHDTLDTFFPQLKDVEKWLKTNNVPYTITLK